REGLEMALEDNTQDWLMQPDGSYVRTQPQDGEPAFGLQEGLWKIYGR
ncbi:polyphosphate kinase, partial [Neisseria sp. P0017.S002]